MQHLNRQFSAISVSEWTTKIAFASSDYHHVNQHFGVTPRLVVYGVKEDEVRLLRVVEFTLAAEHQSDNLTNRIAMLEDCVTLYCVAIGDAVFRELLQIGVRAVRVPEDTPIVGLLQEIQHYWYDKEQRKSARHRDPNRFSPLLLESQWQDDDER